MLLWTTIRLALKSLRANKLRSFLAMLGIIIGVGAVISMLALGAGAQKQIMERISSMGTNLLIIRPGQRGRHGVMSGTQQNLTLGDAEALLAEVEGIERIAPTVTSNTQLKYFNRNTRTSVLGSSLTYFPVRSFEVERGRVFTEGETERRARVAVIGAAVVEKLFERDEPLGATIKVKGINFKVIGIMKSKGDRGWYNPDDQIIVPYTTAMKTLFGLESLREIDIQVRDGADLEKVQAAIKTVLRRRHRLLPGTQDDFYIRNMADILDTYSSVGQTFTVLLGSIASISLLVGGIGIMNIMLVTVTERTREIGIRKAIGAKDRDILRQFLIEAIVMSGLGGMIGVGAGIGTAHLIARFSTFNTVIASASVLLALPLSAAVGIFFGYYPARRAAQLDPIVSLRYE